jgi:DNA repair protein RecO (recombination protein O)
MEPETRIWAGRETDPRVYRTEAVVLRRLSFGETDRVVTLFTRDRGKLSAVAKGARGPRSKLSGVTEPFTYFHGLMAKGQNLDVLTQAEVQSSFSGIRRDLVRVGYASYFAEIVDVGVEERQKMEPLWDLLVGALGTLESAETPDVLARTFELQAISLMGYEPRLDLCVVDEAPVDIPGSVFHPMRGGMLCPRCARSAPGSVPMPPAALIALRMLPYLPLVRAAHSELSTEVRGELVRAMVPYMRHHLAAPLRSLQFLDDVS